MRILLLVSIISISIFFPSVNAQTPQYSKCCGTASTQFPFKSNTAIKVQLWYNTVDFAVLPQNGLISTLYFRSLVSGQTGTFTNLEISLKQPTTGNQFDASNTFITGLTNVLSAASITINGGVAANDWFEIPLTTPFYYDNTLPLVVEILHTPPFGGTGLDNTGTPAAPLNKKIYASSHTATTGTQSNGFWQDFGFDILPAMSPNNTGVTAIVEPNTGCVGSRNVEVEISNNGSNQISSLFVHWSVNGTFQGIVPYTQLLDTMNGAGPSKDTIALGQVNFIATGNYNIKAWTVNPNNQPDTVNFDDSSDVTFTGTNFPVSSLGVDTTICPDQPHNITASSSFPDSVLWNDISSTMNSRVISNSGLYIAEIYKDGCKTEDSILIGLHPAAPPVNLGNDSAFCYGDILTLDATASGVTYQWQDNSSNATFPADTSGLYWVILETANSCRSYDSITLNLYTDPFVNLFASPGTIICYGAPISFIANASTQGSRMFQLVINNANVGSAQSGNFFTNPTVENGDTVRVDLITDQCAATPYSVPSNELVMTVKPKPISINGLSADTVIENTTKNYAVASTGSNSYLWRVFGGSIVADSTTIAVQILWDGPNPNAWVSVTETDVTNCSYENILPVNVISIDGISESGGTFLGSAYPNPANESITIPVNSEKPVDITLSIFDLSGKEVLSIYNGELNGKKNFILSVISLEEGMYFYKLVTSDGGQMTRKLMIQH